MASETTITLVGNLTADPELRFTPSGAAVANFTVASTPRTFDRQTNEWRDGDAMFLNCAVWRQAAENVAESLQKGMRVIVQGRLRSRSYETREGERRTVFEIDVDEIGPALRYATAKVTRNPSGSGSGGQSSRPASSGGSYGEDPWASSSSTQPPVRSSRRRPTRGRRRRATSLVLTHPTFATLRRIRIMADTPPPKRIPKKKSNPLRAGQHRLQGHHDPAEVRLRARQDPGPPGHRAVGPGAAPGRDRHQERSRGGLAAVRVDGSLSQGGRGDEAHPDGRHRQARCGR